MYFHSFSFSFNLYQTPRLTFSFRSFEVSRFKVNLLAIMQWTCNKHDLFHNFSSLIRILDENDLAIFET